MGWVSVENCSCSHGQKSSEFPVKLLAGSPSAKLHPYFRP